MSLSRQGVEISERASRLDCLRGKASIEAGEVRLRAADAEAYGYEGDGDLLMALCRVETTDDILRFVARYGLLWSSPALDQDGVPEWITGRRFLVFTEEVSAWLELTGTLNHLVRLYRHLQYATSNDRYAVDWLRKNHEGFLLAREEVERSSTQALAIDVAMYLTTEISGGLAAEEGMFVVTPSVAPGRFMLLPIAPTLAGHGWLQFAADVLAHVDIRVCLECEKHFVARDPRQVYCSDRCAGRVRARRFRSKHARRGSDR